MTDTVDVSRVRALNDQFRRTFAGGTIFLTAGVLALANGSKARILAAVAAFSGFDASNDPDGEHDFGALAVDGKRLLFKIDCYDRSLRLRSPDPANPVVTRRVLTIMLVEEY